MLRLRTAGAYAVPVSLVLRVQKRHVDVIYPVPPALRLSMGSGWVQAKPQAAAALSAYVDAAAQDAGPQLRWQAAQTYDASGASEWRQSGARDALQAAGWQQALAVSAAMLRASWGKVAEKDSACGAGWSAACPHDDQALAASWRQGRPTDIGVTAPYQDCDLLGAEWRYRDALPPYIPNTQPLRLRFNGRRYIPQGQAYFKFGRSLRGRPLQPRDSRIGVRFGQCSASDVSRRVPWGMAEPLDPPRIGIIYPDYNGPVIIIEPAPEPEIQDTYMIVNTVSVVVLPERVPLDVGQFRLASDLDSYSWSFSAELTGQTSLNLVRPDSGGQKQIEVSISGHVWVLLVERYSRSRKFPAESFSITGASRSQLLAAPYAPKRSAVNAVDINALQAAEDQLLYTGFTVEWDAVQENPVDWTITAGALSYQDQTPMEVIARIAQAVGGFVRPSMNDDSITVLPRYREAVWYWESAIVDRILPADIITSLDGEWAPQPTWNSCYVAGTTHGVAVDVRRAGTAGEHPAPDVYDDLITATSVARARGICELSKGGDIEIVGKTLPLFPAGDSGTPGLVLPGMLCEVRGDGEPWRGLCLGVEIVAEGVGASNVTQSVRLERHTGVQ